MARAQYMNDVVIKDGLWVDARAYGSDLSDTTLAAAVVAIASDDVWLRITPGTWVIDANLDLSGVSVMVDPGAVLTVSGGVTLTLPVAFKAQPGVQCFNSSGTVTFAAATITYPEWWGVDGSSDETEIQAAINSNSGGLVIMDPAGYTLTSAGITVTNNGTTLLCHNTTCMLTTAADIDMVTIGGGQRITVENIGCTNTNGTPTKANFVLADLTKHCKLINLYLLVVVMQLS